MAVSIKAKTNEMVEVKPANGKRFTLEELQAFVGGYIEALGLHDGRIMWLNEEGKLDDLAYNAIATDMARRMSFLPHWDHIVGDVVIATPAESGDDEEEEE